MVALFTSIGSAQARADLRFRLFGACGRLHLMGIMETATDLDRVCPTFHRLRAATNVMEPCAVLLGRLMSLADVLPYRQASAATFVEQEELLLHVFGPFHATARSAEAAAENVERLRVIVEEGGNLAAAAARLNLSESGLREWKQKVERLTGLDLQRDGQQFVLALRLYDLGRDRWPAWDDPWWSRGSGGRPPATD